MKPYDQITDELIKLALEEDRVEADAVTSAFPQFRDSVKAEVIAKEEGIVSGAEVFKRVFEILDSSVKVKIMCKDSSSVKKGDIVISLEGAKASILKGERTALNFLQRLSGVASLTRLFVRELTDSVSELLDTRKTSPGMRFLEKQAVVHGGGRNHRMNLMDMAMIKENHIRAAGSINRAVKMVRDFNPDIEIEVEVRNLDELNEALEEDISVIMLDNFSETDAKKAVEINNKKKKLEISGNVTLKNIRKKGEAGADFISTGAVTHSYRSMDFSLLII